MLLITALYFVTSTGTRPPLNRSISCPKLAEAAGNARGVPNAPLDVPKEGLRSRSRVFAKICHQAKLR